MIDRRGGFAWYELLTTNAAAARAFYASVVGWQAQDASTAAFPYSVFSAGKTEVSGLMELPPDALRMGAEPRWVGYVAVDDIDDTVERLKRLGGSVFVPPTDSNIGRVSIVTDPQKATFGIVGALKRGAPAVEPPLPGTVGWHELLAGDGETAFAFYSELFGWKPAPRENDRLDSYRLVAGRWAYQRRHVQQAAARACAVLVVLFRGHRPRSGGGAGERRRRPRRAGSDGATRRKLDCPLHRSAGGDVFAAREYQPDRH